MAAASSATGASTAHFKAARNRISSEKYRVPISISFPTPLHAAEQRRKLLVVRNSCEETAASTTTEQESEINPVEAPKGPPSLISALNVDKALRGLAITEVDHYGRLGLQAGCSYDQTAEDRLKNTQNNAMLIEVGTAYKSKVAEVMNRGLDQEELTKGLELLKESHSILSTVEERRMYDWSLVRTGDPERFMWPYEVDITPGPTGDPPPQEPEDERPTTLTGYFFLAWLILSFTLLIAFNR